MANNEKPDAARPFAAAISAAVRGVVASRGVSGSQLGRDLNRAQSYVSVRLNGHKSWTVEEVDQIAALLDIDVHDIYDLARKLY